MTEPASEKSAVVAHRRLITLSVMLATIMQALDATIANVALPHMQAAMGTTPDQIALVLTSYIVATAIFMPLSGYLSLRLGRRRLFIWAVVGFTIASMLCGAAQTLDQIVAFRLLQGMFGAALVPLSQAVLLDTYPPSQHGSAMGMWGLGVMVGPVIGPLLGGWLTEYYNWRWVFYINLPFGLLAWFGLVAFVPETRIDRSRRFDILGFVSLGVAVGALQLMLDRGESLAWFTSPEIVAEAVLSVLAFYIFLVHIFNFDHPFIEPSLFKDRNFSIGMLFIFMIGVVLFTTMALLPPFMQTLIGYPVIDIGILLAPRGAGTMAAMLLAGKLSGKIDPRWSLFAGFGLIVLSLWEMEAFTTDVTRWDIVRTGLMQGIGLGLTYVPMTTVTFSTLAAHHRSEGTALFNLMRNIGSSIGISVMFTNLAQRVQINHAAFSEYINPFNMALNRAVESGVYSLATPEGLTTINNEITRQATTLAYLQDFRMMMFATVAILPFIIMLKPPTKAVTSKEVSAALD